MLREKIADQSPRFTQQHRVLQAEALEKKLLSGLIPPAAYGLVFERETRRDVVFEIRRARKLSTFIILFQSIARRGCQAAPLITNQSKHDLFARDKHIKKMINYSVTLKAIVTTIIN